MAGALGRRTPTDFEHVEKYPLRALPVEQQPVHVPMAFGINWYQNFDNPVKEADGRFWIGRGNLGSIRGGHCVCLRSTGQHDSTAWWRFYNQGAEGACVGFGTSRMMSLLNRRRYFARWLWDRAKQADEWSDTNPGDDNGTSVRAACDVLRTKGHVTWKPSYADIDNDPADAYPRSGLTPNPNEGISANRWATSWDDVKRTVGATGNGVPVLNSWGTDYPRVVWLTDEAGARVLAEDGEAAVVTDR
jgi:hypothetical protein